MKGNREALKWAIDQTNERQGKKADYKFVVVTGDLGLEGLVDKDQAYIAAAADELAAMLKDSQVKEWLFLPGNNDLKGEDPGSIGTFDAFIEALQAKLPGIKVVNFRPKENDLAIGVRLEGTCRFIGFNNASFKSNDREVKGLDKNNVMVGGAREFQASQLENVEEVAVRIDRQRSNFIFYHIPEIDDPYAAFEPATQKDAENLAERKANRGKHDKDYPFSAWTVENEVREQWNKLADDPSVKGLFAGHFHSNRCEAYTGMGWLKGTNYAAGSVTKLRICPSLASKKQEKFTVQARGFRDVSIDCSSGQITSNIFWYEKKAGPVLKIVEKDITLSVDPVANAATGLIHLSNPTDKELRLSLSVEDFKNGNGDYGLNTKTLLALASASSAGQPVLETTVPASNTIAVKVDVSNFSEAGEATANLCNYGEPIGKMRAAKWRPPFAVKIVADVPDKPEFTFTKGKTRQVTLKNDDAMTYPVVISAEVDGMRALSSEVVVPPNSSVALELNTNDEWFPASARIKETVRDGIIRIQWKAPNAGNVPLPERVIPVKAHLNSTGEFWQSFWGYGFVLVFVTLGGVCSMILSNWVPNRLSRAGVEELLNDLARKTANLTGRIDSGLRVFLRVERNRLHRLLRSQWIFSANYPDLVKRVGDYLAGLTKQINLAGKLDRAREALEPRLQTNPIPAKIDQIDCELQKAADLLRRCDCSAEDLDAGKVLITQASERISKMDQTDDELLGELKSRVEELKKYFQPGTEPDKLKQWKELLPQLFGRFDRAMVEKLDPKEYSPVNFLATQLELLRQIQAYYKPPPPPLNLPKPEQGKKFWESETFASLQRARLLLREIKEGIYLDRIECALKNKQAKIVIEPTPRYDELLRFAIRFHSDELNTAAARDELRCEWNFGDNTDKEIGWEAFHYFQPEPRNWWQRLWRWVRVGRKPEPITVTATFPRRNPDQNEAKLGNPDQNDAKPGNPDQNETKPRHWWQRFWRWVRVWRKPESTICKVTPTFPSRNPDQNEANPKIPFLERKVEVREAPRNPSADRNLAEVVRLGIALVIALIGLLAGAREQLTKLDLIPAAVAVFLLGFGADTIKNLISPKQAQK
jgi:hypothetical protein